jgi:uncharacterized metal-binding protein YceD (DUF177 family)
MESPFTIFADRLKDGHKEKIQESTAPDFLDIHEKELSFPHPVAISGEAYVSDDHLILHLKIKTEAIIPCLVCNEPIEISIVIENFYHAQDLHEIKSGIFDYTEELREAILLQVPAFIECNSGKCPERETMKKYLKSKPKESSKCETYYPFADLDSK